MNELLLCGQYKRERILPVGEPHDGVMTVMVEFRLHAALSPSLCQPSGDPEVPLAWGFSSYDMDLAILNWQNLGATGKRAIVGRTQRCECLDRAERCYEARSAQWKQKGGKVDKAEIPSSFFPLSSLPPFLSFLPSFFLTLLRLGIEKWGLWNLSFLETFFLLL